MAKRKVWIGSVGPFIFDDAKYYGIKTDGVVSASGTPTEDNDLIRLADIIMAEFRIYGYNGTNYHPIRIDPTTRSIQTVEHPHHEVHGGDAYTAEHNNANGSGTKATISFTTPDTTKWIHLIIDIRSNVEAVYTFGEGATITGASGSDYVPRNRNRNSSNTSVLISAGSTGGAGYVTLGGAVTDFGTVLEVLHFGSGRVGGESRGNNEWLLKQNTTYAMEAESEAASSEVMVEMHWYEQIDKVT